MPPTNAWITQKRYYFLIFCMIVVAGTACSGPTPREKQQAQLLAKLDSSIEREITFIDNQTNLLYYTIEDRLMDPITAEKAKRWHPVTEKIKEYSNTLINYIENISKLLEKSNSDNVLIKEAKGDSLYKALALFKHATLNANELLMSEFGSTIMPTIDTSIETHNKKANHFTQQNFAYLNNEEAQAVLRYWQKEVLIVENKLINFSFVQTTTNFCGLTIEAALIGQSHSALQPGETLTITAGIGSFSRKANPKIYINKKAVNVTADAYAAYKFKVPKQKGNYTIPVTVEFIDQYGAKKKQQMDVSYRVL